MPSYSKITSQGQISVPVEVRRDLQIEPGSTLEWEKVEGGYLVRRGALYSWQDVHELLLPLRTTRPLTLEEMDEGIRRTVRKRDERSR